MPSATTTLVSGQPPVVRRRRRYTRFIPGLGFFGLPSRDPQTGQWGCGPGCLISSLLAVVLTLGGFLFVQLHRPSPPPPPAARASLSIGGNIVPGGTMQIHGSNFPADSTVEITIDGSSVASRSSIMSASTDGVALWRIHPANHIVTVKSDKTFDTTIPVPSNWTPGSRHTIQAATQNVQASTQASIDVVAQPPGQPSNAPQPVSPTVPSQPGAPQPGVPQPAASTPTVSNVNPQKGPVDGGIQVKITGSGFTKAISVSFGLASVRCGVDNTCTVDSDTQITVVIPAENASDASASVPVDVTVTTPNGTSTKSSADLFTYTPLPVITSINPSSGPVSGGISVTISGSGFTGATGFSFGKAMVDCAVSTCKVNSDGTQITVTSPAEDSSDASSNSVDVTVTTTNGTSQTSSADQFTYTASSQPPVMQLSKNSLAFDTFGCDGGSKLQSITITNGGGGTLTWTVDTSSLPSWLTVTPTTGSAPGTLTFTANVPGLNKTSYTLTAGVTITGSDGTMQTVTVKVPVICIL